MLSVHCLEFCFFTVEFLSVIVKTSLFLKDLVLLLLKVSISEFLDFGFELEGFVLKFPIGLDKVVFVGFGVSEVFGQEVVHVVELLDFTCFLFQLSFKVVEFLILFIKRFHYGPVIILKLKVFLLNLLGLSFVLVTDFFVGH